MKRPARTMRPPCSRPRRGLTLIEILITGVIITVCGLSIMASINSGLLFQQTIREENGAIRAAADILDRTRKELFFRLETWEEEVTIDTRGTARTDDDVMGTVRIRFYAPDQNGDYFDSKGQYHREVATPQTPIPTDLTMVIAEATVTWNRAGRMSDTPRQIVLTTFVAP